MPVHGIIITHAQLGQAFIEAVTQIAGPQEDLSAVSNAGLSNEQLLQKLAANLPNDSPTVIFTDFLGGSAQVTARHMMAARPMQGSGPCVAIAGVNLSMLLSFVTKRNKLPFEVLIETLRNDGHRGIQ